jgi:hypothetical protein
MRNAEGGMRNCCYKGNAEGGMRNYCYAGYSLDRYTKSPMSLSYKLREK